MESNSSSSSLDTSPKKPTVDPNIDGLPAIELPAYLHHAPSAFVVEPKDEDYPAVKNFEDAKNICIQETKKVWSIGAPIAFNLVCYYGISSSTNVFAGHIGDLELSAIAISLSVIATFSFGFLNGMASALETLSGQAFGAGQVEMLGVYLQRCWLVMIFASLHLVPVYMYAAPILKFFGQEEAIADLAGKFCIQIIPQMFSMAINFPTQKFLQAQSKVKFLSVIGFVTLLFHIGTLCVFLNVFKWGTSSASVAFNISNWGMTLAQVVYIMGWCKDGWKGFSWLAFKDLWPFAKLSMASAVMMCLEVWYFMIILVITGRLKDPVIAVGSLSICMNVNGWELILFIGINVAVSVRVSNELGSAHPRAAKYAVIVSITETLLLGLLFGAVVLAAKDHFAIIFTKSKEMQEAVSRLASFLALTMVVNSVQHVIAGVAVGGGWQALVAYINLICYYIVGLPLGILLGYRTNMGVKGIWLGLIVGTVMQTLILLYIVYKTNWNKEVQHASERIKQWAGHEGGSQTT